LVFGIGFWERGRVEAFKGISLKELPFEMSYRGTSFGNHEEEVILAF